MEEILSLISAKPAEAVAKLTSQTKDKEQIKKYREEYQDLKRDNRPSQIATTQKDKLVKGKKDKTTGQALTEDKVVPAVRVAVPFQVKIVEIATAFEAGERIKLTPNDQTALSDEIIRLWNVNRIDDKFQSLIETMKSETESCIIFYMKEFDPETNFQVLQGPNPKFDIRCSVKTSKEGKMSPYFDSNGDMIFFTWQYNYKEGDKDINKTLIYDAKNVYTISNASGSDRLDETKPHGFTKIPVVYFGQYKPEWYNVEQMIDRYETSISKLGGSNDYAGHPLLKVYGEIGSMPDRDTDGKVLRFEIKELADGKQVKGDAEFLTMDGAAESVKLEIETLEALIHNLSSTPRFGFDKTQGLGAISGVAIKLMFLDAIIKAKLNEGSNRTSVERILNVLISGVINTIAVGMKTQAQNLFFDVTFRSIIPIDFKELVDYLSTGKEAGIISPRTAVKELGLTDDVDEELAEIAKGEAVEAAASSIKAPGTEPAPVVVE